MLKVEMYKIVNVKEKNVRKMFDDGKLSCFSHNKGTQLITSMDHLLHASKSG